MNDLSINDIAKQRSELEQQILAVLRQFEEQTGLSVTGISLAHEQRVGYRPRLCDVVLDVELARGLS